MASRRDIREAFYGELENAVAAHLSADDVMQEQSEERERLPRVVHDDSYRKVPMNQGSAAPTRVERDQNGDATEEFYTTMHQAVFSVLVVSDDSQIKEDIYEDIRTYFEKFEHPAWDASDIQPDVAWVRVLDSNSEDDVDHEPIARGDRLEIRLTFQRDMGKEGTAIDEVNGGIDTDDDGVEDVSSTTTTTFTSN
jgi:hypothetical protein